MFITFISGLGLNKEIIFKYVFLFIFYKVLFNLESVKGQKVELEKFVSISTIATTHDAIPFWLRSLNYGSIPLDGLSVSGIGGVKKEYSSRKEKKFDWGTSFEGRINAGYKIEGILIEAYAKARYGIFQIKAGRSKDIIGLIDSTLSTGSFSISGNALGIPKIEISVPEYWDLPFTNRLFAFKGNFVHGWMGDQELYSGADNPFVKTYLHQKSLYGRFGKPTWTVNLYGGFNHQVEWGNEKQIYDHQLSNLETFKYVFLGIAYHPGNFPGSKIGNHLGSLDQAISVNLKNHKLFAYHQFFYEAGALASLDNVKDGIFGISIKWKKHTNTLFHVNKLLLEYFNSKSQGGEPDSKSRASSAEDYYNNFLYLKGWNYKGENLGNILITSNKYMRSNLPGVEKKYFDNNRVHAYHIGIDFNFFNWTCKFLSTYSNNFGSYSTAPSHKGPGNTIVYNDPPYFGEVNQFSSSCTISKVLNSGIIICGDLGIDYGDLLYNSIGGLITIKKTF